MNHKKSAMTLVEIVLVIAIIGILMTCFVGVIKHRKSNVEALKTKATLYNIQKVYEYSLSNLRKNGTWTYGTVSDLCKSFKDTINTKGKETPDCTTNIILANGVSICDFSGDWEFKDESGNALKHPYKDIKFDVTGDINCSNDVHNVRIYKDDAIIIPLDEEILLGTNIAKYRVIQKRNNENGNYVETYKVLEKDISFGEAACVSGIAQEFTTEEQKEKIAEGWSCGTQRCDRYFDCEVQIMDIPASVVMFNGNR